MSNATSELTRKRFRETEASDSLNDADPTTSIEPKPSNRNDGSPHAKNGKADDIAPRLQTKTQNRKKSGENSCTNSSSSSLASTSQHTSVDDISGGDEHVHVAKAPYGIVANSRNQDQSDNANSWSEFTTEYASSSTTSDGVSGGEIRRHTYSVPRDKKKQRSSPVRAKDNKTGYTYGELKRTSFEARDSSSGTDIDEIIRRAEHASNPTADSSSSSDDISFFNETKYKNDLKFSDKVPRSKTANEANAPSVCNSSKSGDSNGGLSISTSCLEGIASDITVGEGGFSSAGSGSENVAKNTDSSSSDGETGIHQSPEVDKMNQIEPMPPQGDNGPVPSESLLAACDQQASISGSSNVFQHNSFREDSNQFMPNLLHSLPSASTQNIRPQSLQNYDLHPVDVSSIFNTSYLSSDQVKNLPPIRLDYSLLKRMDEAFTKSHESLQMLKEWDASMGLKSSHSKTMTQSARSRKKLHNKIKRLLKKLDALETN